MEYNATTFINDRSPNMRSGTYLLNVSTIRMNRELSLGRVTHCNDIPAKLGISHN